MYNEHTANKAEGCSRLAESPAEIVLQLASSVSDVSIDALNQINKKLSVYRIEQPSNPNIETGKAVAEFPQYFSDMRDHLDVIRQNFELILQAVRQSGL